MGFADILKSSICRESHNRVWCTQCQQYQPTTSRKSLLDLPLVLSINTGISSKDASTVSSGMFLDESGKGADWLPLRYGVYPFALFPACILCVYAQVETEERLTLHM